MDKLHKVKKYYSFHQINFKPNFYIFSQEVHPYFPCSVIILLLSWIGFDINMVSSMK